MSGDYRRTTHTTKFSKKSTKILEDSVEAVKENHNIFFSTFRYKSAKKQKKMQTSIIHGLF